MAVLDSQGYAVLRTSLWPSICRTETRHVAACDRAGDLLGYRLQAQPTGLQRLKALDHDLSLARRAALLNAQMGSLVIVWSCL